MEPSRERTRMRGWVNAEEGDRLRGRKHNREEERDDDSELSEMPSPHV